MNHPASTTHLQMNVTELIDSGIKLNTVRLERIDDLLEDPEIVFNYG